MYFRLPNLVRLLHFCSEIGTTRKRLRAVLVGAVGAGVLFECFLREAVKRERRFVAVTVAMAFFTSLS